MFFVFAQVNSRADQFNNNNAKQIISNEHLNFPANMYS